MSYKNNYNNFNKVGYSKHPSFLNDKERKSLLDLFKNVTRKYINFDDYKNLESQKLHDKLIEFRKNEPNKFGEMYDLLNISSVVRSIFYKEKFLKCFAETLNTNISNLYLNGFMWRLDSPFDKRNSLDWHQDSPYYQMTHPEYNAGVCWISITKNSKSNGTLKFIPKSHFKLEPFKNQKMNKLKSEQYRLKINKHDKLKTKNLSGNFGDMSCLHMHLKHKSGLNSSSKIRMVIGCRFHCTSKSFNVGKELYFFNSNGKLKLY